MVVQFGLAYFMVEVRTSGTSLETLVHLCYYCNEHCAFEHNEINDTTSSSREQNEEKLPVSVFFFYISTEIGGSR